MRRFFLLFVILSSSSWGAIDAYEFRTPVEEIRFHELTAELRCPKCQNQNIADSDAPIAKDLRREVHRLLIQGAADSEIIDFMVTRYGEFVLYRPQINSQTWLLWYGPYVVLGFGAIVILLIVYTRKANRRVQPGARQYELTPEERARLNALLEKDNKE